MLEKFMERQSKQERKIKELFEEAIENERKLNEEKFKTFKEEMKNKQMRSSPRF